VEPSCECLLTESTETLPKCRPTSPFAVIQRAATLGPALTLPLLGELNADWPASGLVAGVLYRELDRDEKVPEDGLEQELSESGLPVEHVYAVRDEDTTVRRRSSGSGGARRPRAGASETVASDRTDRDVWAAVGTVSDP
jgi:hypothetical protein